MHKLKIAETKDLCWYVFGRDPSRSDNVIDTNEYLIVSGDEAMLLDPGGTEIFPHVVGAVADVIDIRRITCFFASHQDPDIMSSLPLWMGLCPSAKIYMSRIWSGFIAHFGHEYVPQFEKVEDGGMEIRLGGHSLVFVPAHYCHSSGNFSLFDPVNKVLFSGDIGAGLVPQESPLIVEDFEKHVTYMEGFHKRWMPSNRAKNDWVRRVRELGAQYICPQHGSIFKDENVTKFLDWFEGLEVGNAVSA